MSLQSGFIETLKISTQHNIPGRQGMWKLRNRWAIELMSAQGTHWKQDRQKTGDRLPRVAATRTPDLRLTNDANETSGALPLRNLLAALTWRHQSWRPCVEVTSLLFPFRALKARLCSGWLWPYRELLSWADLFTPKAFQRGMRDFSTLLSLSFGEWSPRPIPGRLLLS